jgi:TolB-like protein
MIKTEHAFQFADVVVDCARFAVLKGGRAVKITPRAFEVLLYLIRQPGRVVGKQELFEQVWKEAYVSDNALTRMIKEIRHVIGDDANAPRYIETVPKRGYRFIGAVQETTTERALPATSAQNGDNPTNRLTRVAVLPFQTLGAGQANEYLQFGLADTLITRLSNIERLVVRPTSSVLRYVDDMRDALRAGRELSVDCLLDGHVQRVDKRIRVTVRLLSAHDGAPLWAEKFDEEFTDIFAVQDAITERVMNALTLRLSALEQQRLEKCSTSNTAAYQAYLKGRYFWNKRTEKEIKKAAEHFEQALELDPGFALAWVGLAETYVLYSAYCVTPPREAYPRAEAAVLKALELDSQLAEARATLGLIKYEYYWDWAGAERELERALKLKPHNATIHHWYAGLLIAQGRFAEGLREIKRAQELDPLSLIIHAMTGWYYYYARQYDLALQEVTKALEIDHNFGLGYVLLALVHEGLGWTSAALEAARTGVELLDSSSLSLWALIQVLNAAHRRAEAREWLGRLVGLAEKQYASPYERALIYLSQGEHEMAFAWLEKALEQRDPWVICLKVEPRLDPLRADARFARLLERVGLSAT